VKRVNKLGLKDEYQNQADCKDVIRCLLGLPLLPAADMVCKRFVLPSAQTCRRRGSYSNW